MEAQESMYGPGLVATVEPGSPAEAAGVRPGDMIWEIDGEPMRDIIDYYLLMADDVGHVLSIERDGASSEVEVDSVGASPGIEMEEPLFGRLITCDNRCMFCFVDQLPAGLKDRVYVKDDDYRLSFLQGNFVTLTNLSEGDLERIVEERLSPLYVSVHATDPALRCEMFGNAGAERSLSVLESLLEAGIEIHIQVVLVRGLNDSGALDRTLSDVSAKYGGVASIGVVPVGISRNGRMELPAAYGFDSGSAATVLAQLERWRPEFGDAGPFAADEFFFLAGMEAPPAAYYSGFQQTENGIGLARLFRDAFTVTAERSGMPSGCHGTVIVTTSIGSWTLEGLGIEDTGAGLLVCDNTLFGADVNVCGLLPGRDVVRALAETEGVRRALVPDVALDADGAFIDGVTVNEVAGETCIDIITVANEGAALLRALWDSREGRDVKR